MSKITMRLPQDAMGSAIDRAMGTPIVVDDSVLVSDEDFVDIFDLSADNFKNRVFCGMSISNPSSGTNIEIAFGEFSNVKSIVCGASQFFCLDKMTFGPGVHDESTGTRATKVRAKLSTGQGTPATATIDYTGIQPADGQKFELNGKIYEFSSDMSKDPLASQYWVRIGVDEDASWTNFINKVNQKEQAVRATIDTGNSEVTITSVAGGNKANAITIADVDTGASVSGSTLSGATGGVMPVIHIW